jgi:NitT/TauT family transport system permease protein
MSWLRERARPLIVVGVVFGVWYLAALALDLSGDRLAEAKLPYPHLILERSLRRPEIILDATWQTASRAVAGFALGVAVGLGLGTLMIQARWLESSILPYVLASQMVPLIALVPILRAIVRDPTLVRLYVAGYVTFFIVTIAVLRGLKSVERSALELADSLEAGRLKTLRFVRLPAALPYIFSGLKVAAPLSLVGAIIVDLIGSQNGLGYLMVAAIVVGPSQATLRWAALIISILLGLTFSRLVGVAERRISPWQRQFRVAET